MNRVVNLDWLEVRCLESEPRPAEYFKNLGFQVSSRDYGTRVYAEMFVVFDLGGHPCYEFRRNPFSKKSCGGIFEDNSCHVRCVNAVLYQPDVVNNMRLFLARHGYIYMGMKRVDICLDFQHFDNSFDDEDSPAEFLRTYMRGGLFKICQSNIHEYGVEYMDQVRVYNSKGHEVKDWAIVDSDIQPVSVKRITQVGSLISLHGKDAQRRREWNSIKWGSPSSAISTKLYNKSLELSQVKDKPYIRDCWKRAGFSEDCDVWRVEFSLNSDAKDFVFQDSGEIIRVSLETLDSPSKLLFLFHSLAYKYFHFKVPSLTRTGQPQRKDRCPDYFPFTFSSNESALKNMRIKQRDAIGRTDRMLARRLEKITAEPNDAVLDPVYREAARLLISYFNQRYSESFQSSDELTPDLKLTHENIVSDLTKAQFEKRVSWLLRKLGELGVDASYFL